MVFVVVLWLLHGIPHCSQGMMVLLLRGVCGCSVVTREQQHDCSVVSVVAPSFPGNDSVVVLWYPWLLCHSWGTMSWLLCGVCGCFIVPREQWHGCSMVSVVASLFPGNNSVVTPWCPWLLRCSQCTVPFTVQPFAYTSCTSRLRAPQGSHRMGDQWHQL